MAKLPPPYGYYFKSMVGGICPFCKGCNISVISNKDVIWCDGYGGGTYVDAETCEGFANEKENICNDCFEYDFPHRHVPNDLVMVCQDCKKAINFDTKEISKTFF